MITVTILIISKITITIRMKLIIISLLGSTLRDGETEEGLASLLFQDG